MVTKLILLFTTWVIFTVCIIVELMFMYMVITKDTGDVDKERLSKSMLYTAVILLLSIWLIDYLSFRSKYQYP